MKQIAYAVIAFSLTATLAVAETSTSTSTQVTSHGKGSSSPQSATKRGKVSELQAVQIISRRPEVRSWKREIAAAAKSRGVSAHIELDRTEAGEHVVHVYEDVPDGDGSSHTATFNWYYVNQKNGKVRKEF
ncbi:MAG TPA: hypothetical protein V6C97_28210 [Oculatellaceae cyanobacterium]